MIKTLGNFFMRDVVK